VTEQVGSSEQHSNATQGTPAAGAFQKEIGILQKSRKEIKESLVILDTAKLRLDLLEENTVDIPVSDPFEFGEAVKGRDQTETIRLAAYLYLIARTCRDLIKDKSFNEFLCTAGYTQQDTTTLLNAFDKLADVWSTYSKIIDCLDSATWHAEPSFDQIWTALETPRRRYIRALGSYYAQLSLVLNKLRTGRGTTSGA
jgi:hypothetical protein